MRRYPQKAADPCLFKLLVVHDGQETATSVMPATMICATHPPGHNVGDGSETRPVEPLAARSPQPQEEFVVFCGDFPPQCLNVGREHADPIEHLAPVRHIGGDQT